MLSGQRFAILAMFCFHPHPQNYVTQAFCIAEVEWGRIFLRAYHKKQLNSNLLHWPGDLVRSAPAGEGGDESSEFHPAGGEEVT